MTMVVRSLAKLSVALGLVAWAPGAARGDGTIVCWGDSGDGQCDIPAPNDGWELIAAGFFHSVAQRDDHSILNCWGFDLDYQCNMSFSDHDYLTISVGYDSGVGLHADGTVGGFGANNAVPYPNENFIAAAHGTNHSLFLRTDGSIVSNNGPPPGPNTGFVAVAGGGFHSLGLKADGSIVGWAQFCGALCTPPEPNSGFTAIAAGYSHSLGLKADGSVVGFGSNDHGECNVPEPNSGFTAISAGVFFSVGLKSDGSIVGWGDNSVGQLNVPEPNSGFVAVSAGGYHVLGLKGSGCDDDAACADGIFCNGAETCAGGACEAGGGNPCPPSLFCREADDQCVSCLVNATCDDGLFCNGAEVCGPAGTCQPGANPCPGMGCDQTLNYCTDGGAEVWMTFMDHVFIPQLNAWAYRRDIMARNVTTGKWSFVLDGADLYFDLFIFDGMARLPDGSILLSFTEPVNVYGMIGGPNGTLLDDSDIVRFIPTSLGPNTAGSLVFYFDGSDVGLTTNDEDVDAITLTSSGQLVISTLGPVSANGASGADTDLLRFGATSLGSVTAGSFTMHFDGSDVGLSDNGNEDVDAADIRADGRILLSTLGNFSVPGVSGGDEDVIRFTPTQLGSNTSGSYSMFLDLSALGISASADVGSVEYKE